MKKILKIFLLLVIGISIVGCKKENDNHEKVLDPIDDNYRVFYEIFTGSFSDSDGDGIGDLQGIINRFDYLNDGDINSGNSLGIQGIWLTPIFESPSYHKYDVQDYYKIDPDFGTMDDLKELIELAHSRNVLVIIDLPINHTSSVNDWFLDFKIAHQNGKTTSEYYDFYSWCTRETKPSNRTFNSIQGCNDLYEANFTGDMPELNFDNVKVRNECLNIAKFYLDMGIDGFRFDAAKYIYYSEEEKSVAFWDWYMAELRKIKENIYCVGEVWSNDLETIAYNTSLNCFNFSMSGTTGYIYNAASLGDANVYTNYVVRYINQIHEKNKDAIFMPFISNHDMDRASGFLTVATKRAFMAANLYILCYGSPFIYYGEEIGMKGSRGGAMTDANRRLAMLWGDGDTVEDPIGTTYDKDKQTNGTVKELLNGDDNILKYYMKLIAFRNKYPAIGRGEYSAITLSGTKVGAYKIIYNNEEYYLLHNTLNGSSEIALSKLSSDELVLLDFIGQESSKVENNTLTIGGQSSVLLKKK